MSRFRNHRPAGPTRCLVVLAAAVLAAACSTANPNASSSHIDSSGNSIPGWTTATGSSLHSKTATREYLRGGTVSCTECHGGDLSGGISRTSCLSNTANCHHGTVGGWVAVGAAQAHGASAKRAPGSSGFASCRICHGRYFDGGFSGVSCFPCHSGTVEVPHMAAPWRGTGTDNTHTSTDPSNAPVCALCHFGESGAGHHPPTPPPAGSDPGCFNSTLCHGSEAPHPLGAAWRDPTVGGVDFHGETAKANLRICQGCHGTPGTILFDGGVAPTKCSTCHAAAKAHPTDWQGVRTINAVSITHRTSLNPTSPSGQCAICHNVTGTGAGPNPAAPSCFSSSFTNADGQSRGCHSGGPGSPNHAIPFLDNAHTTVTTAGFSADCGNCHAMTGTSPVASAPLCTVCHTNTAVDPRTTKNCTSCHASPPGGAAGTYPNVAGAHTDHLGLNNGAGTVVNCNTCHNNLGTGTLAHYDRANGRPGAGGRIPPGDAAFVSTYNAKGGSAAFAPLSMTCSNVSCHQGSANTTPNWQTGTIDPTAAASCTLCHQSGSSAGNPQNNSYYSGKHGDHSARPCTDCHDMSSATEGGRNHFTALATAAMEGPASTTYRNSSGVTYTPTGPGTGTCTGECHSQPHDGNTW